MLNWGEFTNSIDFKRPTLFLFIGRPITLVWCSAKIFVSVDRKGNCSVRKWEGDMTQTCSIHLTEAHPGGTWRKERKISHLCVIWLLVNHIFTWGYKNGIPSGLDSFIWNRVWNEQKVNYFVGRKEINMQIRF